MVKGFGSTVYGLWRVSHSAITSYAMHVRVGSRNFRKAFGWQLDLLDPPWPRSSPTRMVADVGIGACQGLSFIHSGQGVWCTVQGLEFGVMVKGLWFRVWSLGFMV